MLIVGVGAEGLSIYAKDARRHVAHSRPLGSEPREGPHKGCSENQHRQRNAECNACPHPKDRPRSRTADPDLSIGERTIWLLRGDGGSRVELLLDLRVAENATATTNSTEPTIHKRKSQRRQFIVSRWRRLNRSSCLGPTIEISGA